MATIMGKSKEEFLRLSEQMHYNAKINRHGLGADHWLACQRMLEEAYYYDRKKSK
jgi:hypothetical protein